MSFLFSLLFSVTAWADEIVVSTSTDSPEHIYTIRGGGANTSRYWSSTGANTASATAAPFAFYKEDSGNDGEYYIYCVSSKTYLSYSNTSFSVGKNKAISVSSKEDAKLWKVSECTYNSNSYFQLQPLDANGNAVGFYANWYSGTSDNTAIGLWSGSGSSDGGSAWNIESVADVEDISYTITVDGATCTGTAKGVANSKIYWFGTDLVTFSDATWSSDGKTYTATATLSDKYIRVQSKGTNVNYLFADNSKIRMDANTLPTNESGVNGKYKWTFIPCFDGSIVTYKIRNNNGKYISTTGVTANFPSSHLPLADEGTAFCYGTCTGTGSGFYVPGTTNYISINSPDGTKQYMFLWTKSDNATHIGSNLTFVTPADFDALMTSLKTAKTTADSYTVGTAPGQYTATDDFTAAKTKAAAIIDGTTYATAAEFTTCTSNLSLTLNVPQAGKFYTFQETTKSYYLTPLDTVVSGKGHRLAMSKTASEANRIFYFNGSCLMGYSNGYFVVSSSSGMLVQGSVGATSGAALSFSSGDTSEGSLVVRYNSGNRTLYGGYGYSDGAGSGKTGEGYRFYVCEVTDLPLTIGTNGWATFSAPVAVTVPDGVTAYYAPSAPDDGKLVLEEVTGAVPANTGIIVRGTEGKTVNFSTVTTGTEEATVSGNLLQSNVSVNSIEGASGDGKYALATNTTVTPKVTGFMKLNTTITLPGHKCWLQTSTSASSGKFLPLALTDDPTGIETAETAVSDSDAPVYDLQGRKVASTRKGGMYIQNGKVFIAM